MKLRHLCIKNRILITYLCMLINLASEGLNYYILLNYALILLFY